MPEGNAPPVVVIRIGGQSGVTKVGIMPRFWTWRAEATWGGFLIAVLAASLAGCADHVRAPNASQLAACARAGRVESAVDVNRVRKAQLCTGPYRVVPGDVLEFAMPALFRAITAGELQNAQQGREADSPHLCRVGEEGTVRLPAIGEVKVAGCSLAEIETKVSAAYRQIVVAEPSVFVRVAEYRMAKVYITGAVQKPGVYALRSDQMTLVSLLTEAGGIVETGAAVIRVVRGGDAPAGDVPSATPGESGVILPVVGTNTPFRDVALEEGDTVVVQQIQVPLFSVLGLVCRPGNFPYPPTAEYNLTQAIAFAGGLDPVADPRYATVYRLDGEGAIVRVSFPLVHKNQFTDALNTAIRPGDVVAIEHTPRTRMNTTIHNLLRINAGVYVTGNDLWDRD